jgi:hypothetical protein
MYTYDFARLRVPAETAETPQQRRRPSTAVHAVAGLVGRARTAFAARHDAYVRRAIAERHEVLAHHREVGGDFSVLP